MRRLTIVVIPFDGKSRHQIAIPRWFLNIILASSLGLFWSLGYFFADYIEIKSENRKIEEILSQNEGLKGEARVLQTSLNDVKRSLRRVQDYTTKLSEIANFKVQRLSRRTGIGPLTPEEYKVVTQDQNLSEQPTNYVPLGISIEKLEFKPIFEDLHSIGSVANIQAVELQHLISTLSQQKSILSSIPTVSPVNGWITSAFGRRTSPFTNEQTSHLGLDVAAGVGTPIRSPADGVVIFAGNKEGFGRMIMIAHGYGIITRYGHNAENMVQPGQRIKRGEQIGTVGMSGRTTGPHVHYEVWVNGQVADPAKFILDISSEDLLALNP